jgi:hypothetical protein
MDGSHTAIEAHLGFRQQLTLNAGRQIQIVLQGTLFLRREMIEAETRQWICEHTLGLDRLSARLAEAERTGVDPPQSRIDFPQEAFNLGRFVQPDACDLKFVTSIEELVAEERNCSGGVHGRTL